MQTLFEKIGGMSKIRILADAFYDVMEEDPFASELRAIHPENLHTTRNRLYQFVTQLFGGPEMFGKAYVNVEWLERRHRHKGVNGVLARQWLYCMEKAMCNLGYDTELQSEAYTMFEGLISGMLQINRQSETAIKGDGG